MNKFLLGCAFSGVGLFILACLIIANFQKTSETQSLPKKEEQASIPTKTSPYPSVPDTQLLPSDSLQKGPSSSLTPVQSASSDNGHWCNLPYRPVDPAAPAPDKPRPQMPFTIEYGPRSFSGVALVDSGADDTLFPLSYARALGIDLSKTPTNFSEGVGGITLVHHAEVTLHLMLCGQEFSYPVNAAFADGIEELGPLLGQTGFLDQFHVIFRKTEGVFAVNLPSPQTIEVTKLSPSIPISADTDACTDDTCREIWPEVEKWASSIQSWDLALYRTFYSDLLTRYYGRANVPADEVVGDISRASRYSEREIAVSNPTLQAIGNGEIQVDYDKTYRFSGPNSRLNQGKVKAALRFVQTDGIWKWKITSEFDRAICWSTLTRDPFMQSPPGICQ